MAKIVEAKAKWVALALGLVAIPLTMDPAEARYRGSDPVCVAGVGRGDVLNVRAQPSRHSQRIGFFDSNDCHMNVEAVDGNWTYVRGSSRGRNMQGWVNNRFLRPAAAPRQSDPQMQGRRGPFPLQAATGGGIVRGGPGTQFRRLTSLPEFAPITVTGSTGVMFNGYPWFTIQYRGNRNGFMWGGIICSTHTPFQGTFDSCANFRASLQGQGQQQQQPQQPDQTVHRNSVTYSCNEGIPLQVTFIADANETYALYSHDSGPKIRVTQVQSGSGLRYTNGHHELQGKGPEMMLIEGGQLIDRCFAN
ncbi:MliC family protein [Cohaesibacter intestini]|uniref:MliC family protein n=1 Tax=Cohaesibacter intestini TaxID=2211145 RepID=UPI00130086F1|nr:MliC family protein [Cohaesibacter intestini]